MLRVFMLTKLKGTKMNAASQSHFLQQAYLLATGRGASAAILSQLEALVLEEGGSFRLVAEPVNALFGSLAAANGEAATLKSIAFNGLGLTLSDTQALDIHAQLVAAGIDTWAKVFDFCIGLQNEIGLVLDHRAHAAQGFNATLAAMGKAELFSGETVNAAVANLLQNIGSSTTSLSNGIAGLGILASKLTSAGIVSAVVDGYVAGATVFVDTNGDGQLSAGEFSTSTDVSGNFILPGDGEAGAVVAFGGTDLFTGKAFQGTLSAVAGATVLNPFTTVVHTLLSVGYSASIAQAVSVVQTGLGVPSGINLLTYDAMSVLASSTATPPEKAEALIVQALSLQLANLLAQLMATIDAANMAAGISGGSAKQVASAVAAALLTAAESGALDLTDAAVLTAIVKTAAIAAGATVVADAANQIALVIAASNASAATATTTTQLSQAAVISQGAAIDALVSGALLGSFESAVAAFTGTNLTMQVSTAMPGLIAPGVATDPIPAPAPAPAPPAQEPFTFVANEAGGVVTFSGTSQGVISVAWAGTAGASVATFTRGGISATAIVDFAGTATKVSLAAGQTLSGTVAQMKGLTIDGAGAVVLTDGSASAAELVTIDALSTVNITATSILNITGSAEQIAAVTTSAGITKAVTFTATIDAGTTAAADLMLIDAATSLAVNASLVTTLTGSALDVLTVVEAAGIIKALDYAVTLSGPASVDEVNAIDGANGSGLVTATLIDSSVAALAALNGGIGDVAATVNDAAGTVVTAVALSTLGGKTTGVVTVTNAVAITGTAAELTAALVTAETLVVADTATVTISDPAGTALDASTLSALGGKTTGVVTITHGVAITGTVAEVTAALVTADTLVVAGAATVTITDAVTVAEANAIAGRTTGVVTATISDTLDNLAALAGTGNAYTVTVDDIAGTAVTASALNTLSSKTTGMVTIAHAVAITGTAAEVTAALVTADTLTVAGAATVTITGAVTVAEVNAIAAKTSGVVTATISDTLDNLAALAGTGNAYTVTVDDIDGTAVTAAALSALGGKTTGVVTIAHAVDITGTVAEVTAALETADTLVVAGVASVTITDAAATSISASLLGTLGGKTTGIVTVTDAVEISGTLAEVTAALVTPDTLVVAGTATVAITDVATTWLSASALSAIGGKTTGVVTVNNAVTITGTAVEVLDALLVADTLVVAGTATVTVTDGPILVTQANDIADKTTGAVSAGISANLDDLASLMETGNAYTITVTDGWGTALTASALSTLDGKTSGVVTVENTVIMTGTYQDVSAVINAPGISMPADYYVELANSISVAQANLIDAVNGGGIITATINPDSAATLAALTADGAMNAYAVTITVAPGEFTQAHDLRMIHNATSEPRDATAVTGIIGTGEDLFAIYQDATFGYWVGLGNEAVKMMAPFNDIFVYYSYVAGATTGPVSDAWLNLDGLVMVYLSSLEAGDSFNVEMNFANHTSTMNAFAVDGALNWYYSADDGRLVLETFDDGITHRTTAVVLYAAENSLYITSVTESGGIFTMG
jgi:hypothetical protein